MCAHFYQRASTFCTAAGVCTQNGRLGVDFVPELMEYRLLLSTAAFLAAGVGATMIYRSKVQSVESARREVNSIVATTV